nr:NAD(P)/FAD-dependent oxidoreductase [uncultured Anaerotignum sp.]
MKIIIIGGGASGMMAALSARKQGAEVCVLERQARVGRKLLATGNGRCNLTNTKLTPKNYHGQNAAFAQTALQAFNTKSTLAFFQSLGLLSTVEPSGKVYPLSDQAGSVVDVLRLALEETGVEIRTSFEVTELKRSKKREFRIFSKEETLRADAVIICCGGMAGGKLGGTQSGYDLLKSQGHTLTKLFPALVQVKTDTAFVKALKGVRADGAVLVERNGKILAENAGEIQFTDFGISGPTVFEISRVISTGKAPLTVHLNLLRNLSHEEVVSLLQNRKKTMPHQALENFLTGILHNRLGRTILRYAGFGLAEPIHSLMPSDIKRIAHAIQDFSLSVLGTMGFDAAQVTAGGIRTEEFNPSTMESRLVPGLFAAGEVLDIDGDCGGYNLQWAWASGYLAGKSAAEPKTFSPKK